ncbi:hypothetical protein BDV96DRAFT_591141 [Lophiotrema nucula]|uniref:Uncharacterized protein n=1 Tax=Lophiotrema nucula TaxID=690887 RepID=A0A6A5YHG6_9PLEO|nr:hypothetical protein BDV96DRAFT_591141 [Lophiotrema nucula]
MRTSTYAVLILPCEHPELAIALVYSLRCLVLVSVASLTFLVMTSHPHILLATQTEPVTDLGLLAVFSCAVIRLHSGCMRVLRPLAAQTARQPMSAAWAIWWVPIVGSLRTTTVVAEPGANPDIFRLAIRRLRRLRWMAVLLMLMWSWRSRRWCCARCMRRGEITGWRACALLRTLWSVVAGLSLRCDG